jgi:hypothetical protein
VDLDVPLEAAPHGNPTAAGKLRLRGYVIRSEHITSNGGWCGVAVQFPGHAPEDQPAREAVPIPRPGKL